MNWHQIWATPLQNYYLTKHVCRVFSAIILIYEYIPHQKINEEEVGYNENEK